MARLIILERRNTWIGAGVWGAFVASERRLYDVNFMQSRIHRPNGHRHIIIITMFIPTNANSVSLCLKNNLAFAWQLGLSFVCQSKCQNAVHLSNHKETQRKEIWRRYFSSFYIGLTINNRIACPSWWRHRILDKTMKYFWKQRPFLMPLPLPSSNHLYCGPFVQRVLIFYQYVLIYVESTVGSISWILSHSWCALCVRPPWMVCKFDMAVAVVVLMLA